MTSPWFTMTLPTMMLPAAFQPPLVSCIALFGDAEHLTP